MPVLTGVDLLRIQEYVFGSNRLRDVAAASLAVERATDPQAGLRLPYEKIILAAGGNALLVFENIEEARRWTADFTRRLEDELAPELEAAIVHREFQPGGLALAWLELQKDLARQKLARKPSAPQLGLSVTASCGLTGRPAVDVDEDGTPVGRRVAALRKYRSLLTNRWKPFLPAELHGAPQWQAEFPLELDELGRSRGETSLIGVVHVDGNGVGPHIQRWLERSGEAPDDEVMRQAREWSEDLRRLGETVFRSLIERVAACVIPDRHGKSAELLGVPEELKFELATESSKVYLPLRPIVLGGDDLTLVCDGRIALDLAATAVRTFEQQRVRHLGERGGDTNITACAGVAIVRSHAPFFRAYEAAKMLCASAKKARREATADPEAAKAGWMDWTIGTTRPLASLEDVRAAYRAGKYLLTMRPYAVTDVSRRQNWTWLDLEVLGPGTQGNATGFRGDPAWAQSRNRVKQLESLVRSGPDAVKRQLAIWRATSHGLQLPRSLDDGGFVGTATPIVDALELMDLHLRLERPAKAPAASHGEEG
ncbi:MAG: hypothetical protein RMI94_14145 [Bryobacterales bacterium]|nr:hypothetical protein [Bryobacterales bacterium]